MFDYLSVVEMNSKQSCQMQFGKKQDSRSKGLVIGKQMFSTDTIIPCMDEIDLVSMTWYLYSYFMYFIHKFRKPPMSQNPLFELLSPGYGTHALRWQFCTEFLCHKTDRGRPSALGKRLCSKRYIQGTYNVYRADYAGHSAEPLLGGVYAPCSFHNLPPCSLLLSHFCPLLLFNIFLLLFHFSLLPAPFSFFFMLLDFCLAPRSFLEFFSVPCSF